MSDGPLSLSETRELLARLAHMPKKWLGQNFLVDGNIVRKSLELGEVKAGDTVVEVGPGLGTLTRTLLGAGVELFAVEADRTMVYHLETTLQPRYPATFHLHEGDAVDFPRAGLKAATDGSFKVIANLPYAISTPWMDAICAGAHPSLMVLMLQREAAERLTAEVGTGHWSAVTAQVQLAFERVIIETTGLADPAPVAQTFFVDESISEAYLLDSIVTVVDAKHAPLQLDEHHEAQEQVGFADRILLSKTDLVLEEEVVALVERLRRMNPRAPVKRVHFGEADIRELLDVRGFNLNSILEIEPAFLEDVTHEHDDEIGSFAWREDRPFDMAKLEDFLDGVIRFYGQDLLRYKGVLNVAGEDTRMVFQGVHMMMGGSAGRRWLAGEKRTSTMVFIGRNLPRELLEQGLALCVEGAPEPVAPGAAVR
jgi:G3E family GTPase